MIKKQEEHEHSRRWWMILYLDITMVLLTFFVFLTTFTEQNQDKVEVFQKYFKKSLFMEGEGRDGALSLADIHQGDPLSIIVNRMKSEGINENLVNQFLTANQIKELQVMDGKQGVVVIIPEVVLFTEGTIEIQKNSLRFLEKISFLAAELPYLVEIKGYSRSDVPTGFNDPLEFSAQRATSVYNFFLEKNVSPMKLKITGVGDAYVNSGIDQNKVEIIFKDLEL